jgi:adenine phosphoribosyltransferase
MLDLKSKIREIPGWPKPGVSFKDITTLLEDKDAFRQAVDLLVAPFAGQKIDKVVGIDARGFLLAAPVAYKLNTGLAIVRKLGKLPSNSIKQEYMLEYASNTIEMHDDAIKPEENIILIDDLCATGGTALAACDLIERLGGKIMGVSFLIDLPFLGGSKKLRNRGYKLYSLVEYDAE